MSGRVGLWTHAESHDDVSHGRGKLLIFNCNGDVADIVIRYL